MMAVAAALAMACTGNNVKYDISAINAPDEGAVVYLYDHLSATNIDSTVVSGGVFELKGKAAKDAYLSVNLVGNDWWFPFFNDGQPVQLDYNGYILTGSEQNNKLAECDRRDSDAYKTYNDFLNEYLSLPEEEQMAREEEFVPQYRAKIEEYRNVFKGIIDDNQDNLIPVAFIEHVPSLLGEEKFFELVNSDAPFAKHPFVVEYKRKVEESNAKMEAMEQKKQEIVGQHFLDLEEPDVNGNMHKLSEYVGQGKWVLVDFWAAWCGPCHAEMPNVVAAYKKYHDKGFEVVGLSFDREKEDWVKAIDEWEMPWIHLSDLQYWKSVAGEVYSVNSIPDNLLIDPDGTVVARCLRGEDLEAKLSQIFE